MKKMPEWIEKICVKAVLAMLLVISGVFCYWAVRYTHWYPYDLSEGYVEIVPDSLWRNAAVVLVTLVMSWMLQRVILRGSKERQRRVVRRIALGATLLMGGLLFWWVFACRITPVWDQLQVYLDALDFKAGNFQDMKGYIFMMPHQYGLTLLYEIFLTFGGGWRLLQCVNVVMAMCTVYCSYLIVDELFEDARASLYTVIEAVLFFPMWLYVNYVYGEMLSVGFSTVGLMFMVRFCKREKVWSLVWALLFLAVAVQARNNVLVVLIAVCITLLVYGLRKRSRKLLIAAALTILVPLGAIGAVRASYELRSGIRIEGGIPASMYIAMGMQMSGNGNAGVYNGYNNSVFRGEADSDRDKANGIAFAYMKERMREFREDPAMAKDFYKRKIQLQWNEPTFCSMVMTNTFEQPPAGFVEKLYHGAGQQDFRNYMNRYVTVLYAGCVLFCILMLSGKTDMAQCMLPVGIIGGFLFSILWEAKSRYVLPYILLLIPCMAVGISLAQEYAVRGLSWLAGRLREKQEKKGQKGAAG